MRLPKAVRDNLLFLLAETNSQIANFQVLLETQATTVAQRILDRRGYTYNLKMRIHDGCVDALRHGPKGSLNVFSLRAAEAIASDLERISHICFECVRFVGNIDDAKVLKKSGISILVDEALRGIELIEQAIDQEDTKTALKLGNIERKLDRLYNNIFRAHIKEMRKSKKAEDIVTTLFIAQRIEEIGDVLLSVSESVMSAQLGQPMHIDRFRSLKTALSDLGLIEAEVEPIAETKSGSGISGISDKTTEDDGYVAIFKDGKKEKLKEERESVENWHEIFPGLAPQILSYSKNGKNASLLIEHLPGLTFDKILLQEDDEVLEKALKHLCKTLKAVWKETKRKKSFAPDHMGQLQKRLAQVTDIHSSFATAPVKVGEQDVLSLTDLMEKAKALEEKISPPFSVYIHGDFNLDNIIFDEEAKKIKFIDLHRSCYQDYTQDVSVFMISNYRLQVLDRKTRKRIQLAACHMYDFARDFAHKNGDKTFDLRLALGLARSFISSTRFILDAELANAMFLRGTFILERVAELEEKDVNAFTLPIKELFA
ncbi:PhoU domain-containing protein [Terasakiella sp. A23]|uniref:PhoU domain-containing protein n=1 Tax=Terasakiella sp. FCG-A23 TaxID=3080561 RepID=UPI002953DE7F|nr:PhoU domain-containing protein [Terasakiella sp. A23]MDV7338230.1 PhoU domain-containing protein [Terasakiella sp. A23]